MKKLSFMVYHKEYKDFLEYLREIGVVHVQELSSGNIEDEALQNKLLLFKQIAEAIKRLSRIDIDKRKTEQPAVSPEHISGKKVLKNLEAIEARQVELKHTISHYAKLVETIQPWGNFNQATCNKQLAEANLQMSFFICNESAYQEEWDDVYNAVQVNKEGSRLYFITLTEPGVSIDVNAELVKLPTESLEDAKESLQIATQAAEDLEEQLKVMAATQLEALVNYQNDVQGTIEFSKVVLNTQAAADEKIMILQGWAPASETDEIAVKLDKSTAYYDIVDPTPDDDVPIELSNKGLFAWFEPICKLYMLPKYNELDLTPFFAPFFMIFFGLCLGDSGYGLFLLVAVSLYRFFAKDISSTMKPILSLVQVLGASTFFCGLLTGGFFGASLYDLQWPIAQKLKSLVYLDNGQMFNLSLILGVVQIMFGMILKAVNETIQFGFKYAVGTIGWIVFLLNTFILAAFPSLGTIGSTTYWIVSGICALAIFLYNDPSKNIFTNVGLGVWNTYNMATGLLGDILSYVRLFALGLSGGILASVFNSLAKGMSPDNIIAGPIVMVLIFVIGHSINIFMNVLGAMVHPMRLTFVEFFQNAGYSGGGKEYKPFKKVN